MKTVSRARRPQQVKTVTLRLSCSWRGVGQVMGVVFTTRRPVHGCVKDQHHCCSTGRLKSRPTEMHNSCIPDVCIPLPKSYQAFKLCGREPHLSALIRSSFCFSSEVPFPLLPLYPFFPSSTAPLSASSASLGSSSSLHRPSTQSFPLPEAQSGCEEEASIAEVVQNGR